MSEKGIPNGYKKVAEGEVYTNGLTILVVGSPAPDEHLPEGERHNCDMMGCGRVHVTYVARLSST